MKQLIFFYLPNIITVKSLKSKKKKLALTLFYYVSWEIWLGNSKNLIWKDQSRVYIFSHPRNSKMFNIISKYFSFFNNKPPTIWVAHITRDFLTCYSCSYYSSMLRHNRLYCRSFFIIQFHATDLFLYPGNIRKHLFFSFLMYSEGIERD